MPDLLERLKTALADRYAVESEIGRGGMATVFLAEDLKHRRKVAIKVMDPDLAAAVGAERFLREIEIVAGLNHPNILPLHDSGEADGLLYYVMPYVEGDSLRGRIDREVQLPLDRALRIAEGIADGLEHAHQHGVIHRDIKPSNILLIEGKPVIADFGVARAIEEAGGGRMTATGLAVGTPTYMSPEQAAGGSPADPRTDIYALGCVLYEMLGGEAPYTGPTPQVILVRKATDPVPDLRAIRETIPQGVQTVVERALVRLPADRYQSAGEMAAALRKVKPGDTTPMRPETRRGSPSRVAAAAAALIVVALGAWWFLAGREPPAGDSGPALNTIAVLPFANIGGDEANAAFVDGIHNDILGQLAGISGVTTISRTSVMEYRNAEKSLREIANELGVATVMEGSVQRAGGTVRVSVQVVDAATDAQLWGQTYDRELTAENVFAIQAQISENVTAALAAELTAEERAQLETPLTDNLEAYDLYVKSFSYINEVYEEELAVELLEQAVTLDPEFAAAWAELAGAFGQLAYKNRGRPEAAGYCDGAREAIDRALDLDPYLPEVRSRAGWFEYRCTGDYDRALSYLEEAVRLVPDNDLFLEGKGLLLRRLGRYDEAVETYQRALELSPRYTDLDYHLIFVFREMRRFRDAERHLEHALSLRPDNGTYFSAGVETYILEGDLGKARALLSRAQDLGTMLAAHALFEALIDTWEGRYERVLQALESAAPVRVGSWHSGRRWPVRLAAQLRGEALWLAGEHDAARVQYDSARVALEGMVSDVPEDADLRTALGFTYARLGMRELAVEQGEKAVELKPIERDAPDGRIQLEHLARIYTAVGEHEAALELLERLLRMRSAVNPEYLEIDPTWDPLRGDPRFQALLSESAT